ALRLLRFGTMVGVILAALYAWEEATTCPTGWKRLDAIKSSALLVVALAMFELVVAADGWAGRVASVVPVAVIVALGVALNRARRSQVPVNTRPVWLLVGAFAAIGLLQFARWDRSAPALEIDLNFCCTLAAWVLAYGWMADPNLLSLHTFYKARLTRAYLGA